MTSRNLSKRALEKRIAAVYLDEYSQDIAGLVLFGSITSSRFIPGTSDIDSLAVFKKDFEDQQQMEEQKKKIIERLKDIKYTVLHMAGVNQYRERLYGEGTWASWITLTKGGKVIYSTPEFEKFRTYLMDHPIPPQKIIAYVHRKDAFELGSLSEALKEGRATKWLFSHLRRKLQILSYYSGNKAEFDYIKCLKNLNDAEYRHELATINTMYTERKELTKQQARQYETIAQALTKKIEEVFK